MNHPVVYALGITRPDGSKWFAAMDCCRSCPLLTRSRWRARTWETLADLVGWLDAIPDEFHTKDGKSPKSPRSWMVGLTLQAVPIDHVVGEPIPLNVRMPEGELV